MIEMIEIEASVYRPFSDTTWIARVGDLVSEAKSRATTLDELKQRILRMCAHANDFGHLVIHADGAVTICQWAGDGIAQSRVRNGALGVTTSAPWASTFEAAEDAVRHWGPGSIIGL